MDTTTGASIDMLDKMAVKEIEDEIKNIDGIDKMATVVSAGKFSIILELEKRVDKYNTAQKVKDAVTLSKQNLPSDMDEPTVKVLAVKRSHYAHCQSLLHTASQEALTTGSQYTQR